MSTKGCSAYGTPGEQTRWRIVLYLDRCDGAETDFRFACLRDKFAVAPTRFASGRRSRRTNVVVAALWLAPHQGIDRRGQPSNGSRSSETFVESSRIVI